MIDAGARYRKISGNGGRFSYLWKSRHRKKQLRTERGIKNQMKLSAMKRAGVLGKCEKTLLEAFLMFVPFLDTGWRLFSREWCVCVVSNGYRFFIGVRAVLVVLLVDCWGNVVNLVWILWSWTFIACRRGELWGVVGEKYGYHWIFRQCPLTLPPDFRKVPQK